MDKVNNRLFIGHHGPSRYDMYQLNERGLPLRRRADLGIGRSLIGRGFSWLGVMGDTYLNRPGGGSFDPVHQRLLIRDEGRIMVFDMHPETLAKLKPGELPRAIAVLGQPDFYSRETGPAPNIGSGATAVDAEHQRLFVADSANSRILVWDIRPQVLRSGMDAMAVIGQPDFYSREPGIGRDKVRPRGLAYDPVRKHLYAADSGNHRVLVFDVAPEKLRSGMDAMAVIGQPDFNTRKPRRNLRKLISGSIDVDYVHQRLFVGEGYGNRLLVFDVSDLKEAQNPDAVAVLGQADFETTDPAVSESRLVMPRVTIDSQLQLAYIPDGYPAGNRINIVDVSPDTMKTALTPIIDQIGHINADGEPDFLSRAANDRASPRYWTQGRDVTLDLENHRLFLSDNYGARILIFQLDRMNRLQDRDAKWVLGQPDLFTTHVRPGRTAWSIKLPLAVQYDPPNQRLFVADTWNDRVLVFDMAPEKTRNQMEASYVLGQDDFTTREIDPQGRLDPSGMTQWVPTRPNRIYFASRVGAGIGSRDSRAAELALDAGNQRLFVSDGGHNRVLVFDVHPDRIRNGADAIAVIGQKDFYSHEEGVSANRWARPGDLAYDAEHRRLFVDVPWQHRILMFEVSPERLAREKDIKASIIIGQPDFNSTEPGASGRKFQQPDGLAYDPNRHHLYASDKFNNRVLIFDVRPEVLENFPEAIGVLGEVDLENVRLGPENPRHFADRIFDPRGSAFDPVDERLFLTDVFNARINVYTLPRTRYRVDLPARSRLRYESLDAQTSVGPEDLMVGHSEVSLSRPARVLGVSTHLVTRPVIEPQSERESRVLLSEAQLAVPPAGSEAQVFFDSRAGARVSLSVVNAGAEGADVAFQLRLESGSRHSAGRRLQGGEQLSVDAAELVGGVEEESCGVLRISSRVPLQVGALLQLPNGRGDFIPVPAPVARGRAPGASQRVLPRVVSGAGYRMSYVLMNAGSERMRGSLEVEGRVVDYAIEPGSLFVHEEAEVAQPLRVSHAVIRAREGGAPEAAALLRLRRRDGTLQTASIVSSEQEGTLFWAPLDTHATLLRHGEIKMRLTVANEGPVPATVYLEYFDIDGRSQARYERIVPLGMRMGMGLEDAFGHSRLRGTLRVFADSEASFSLEKRIVNVEGELIVSDVPLQKTPQRAAATLVFPLFTNGSGTATELEMINTSRFATEGGLMVRDPRGTALKIVLR